MTDAATQNTSITVTDAGPSRKKIAISIPAATVTEKLRSGLDALSASAEIPGFRRGRAPRQLLQKKFGEALARDAKQQLVADAVQEAVESHKLRVVGNAVPDDAFANASIAEGKPFAFSVEIEVMPEFTLPSLEGVPVLKPAITATDAMVEDEINKFRVNEGDLESRDSAEPGDYLSGHAIMKGDADGHEFYNLDGAVIQKPTADKAGKGMILGILVDNFDAQVGSPKPGDTITVKTKGQENHEIERLRGTPVTVTFTVKRIDRIIPAPMEKVLQLSGAPSEQALRDGLRQRLEQRVRVEVQSAMRSQIARHLVDNTSMELPTRLTESQVGRTLERKRVELMYRGFDPLKIEEHLAELRSASAEQAARELKLFFILNQAADNLGIQVTEGEMNQTIAMMAYQRGVRPEKFRQELASANRLGSVYQQIREHKTIDAVLARAAVTEVSEDEFKKSAKL